MKLIVLTYSEIDYMLKVLIYPLIQSKKAGLSVEAGINSHIRLYADTGQNLEEGIATKGIYKTRSPIWIVLIHLNLTN